MDKKAQTSIENRELWFLDNGQVASISKAHSVTFSGTKPHAKIDITHATSIEVMSLAKNPTQPDLIANLKKRK